MQKQPQDRQIIATLTAIIFASSLVLPVIAAADPPQTRVVLIDVDGNDDSVTTDIHYFVEKGIRLSGRNVQLSPLDAVLNAGAQAQDIQNIAFGQEALAQGLSAFQRQDYNEATDQLSQAATYFEQSFAFLDNASHYIQTLVHHGVALIRSGDPTVGLQVLEKAFVLKPKLKSANFPNEADSFAKARVNAQNRDLSTIVVATSPDASRVFVDGGYRGVSTVFRPGRRQGLHFIRIEQQGYARVGKVVNTQGLNNPDNEIKLDIVLETARKKAALDALLPTLRVEFGNSTTRPGLQRIQNLLLIDHIILFRTSGDITNTLVELALYNLSSGRRLNAIKTTVNWDKRKANKSRVIDAAKKLLSVDLDTIIKVSDTLGAQQGSSVFSSWWFWTVVGVATVGATVGVVLALQPEEVDTGLPRDGNGAMILRF